MLTDQLFRAAAARKNQATLNDLVADTGYVRKDVIAEIDALVAVGAVEIQDDGIVKFKIRRTEARDRLVEAALKETGLISRDLLNGTLPEHTSAQVYTSLQRLILKGQVKQVRDGTRTPVYATA